MLNHKTPQSRSRGVGLVRRAALARSGVQRGSGFGVYGASGLELWGVSLVLLGVGFRI